MNTLSLTPTEIAKCPNPECPGGICRVINTKGKNPWYYVQCRMDIDKRPLTRGCGYCGPEAMTPDEAIRLHNIICTHPHNEGLCVECDDSGPLPALAPFEKLVEEWRAVENPYNPEGKFAAEGEIYCSVYHDCADELAAVVEEVRGK